MLTEMTTVYRKSIALFTFVESHAPTYLSTQDGKTAEQLAKLCHVSVDRFHRLLNYMQSLGVLLEKDDKFYLTEQCSSLSDPNSLETLHIKFELNPICWSSWTKYNASLNEENDKSSFEIHYHEKFFDYLGHEQNKVLKNTFDNLMSKVTNIMNEDIIKHIPLHNISSVIDVGGGKGALAKEIKKNHPNINCAVMDQYDFSQQESEGITFINGNFFSAIPSGYDAYCMKNVLHNWPDEKVVDILKNCYQAMHKDSTLYIIDMIKERNNAEAESFDLYMDVLLLGKERYQSEFEALAKQTGFTITNMYKMSVSKTGAPPHVIEMKK
ncbi:methyltransferase [Xenorhabdus bovienii]|uniref:Methyltransferase n=2 Tax=Xenorhabdus bovienii TaxID=40576 RepID=A0AAJ1J388_XENBV|nr:methyltransferase [Xenorhabdus bovienii]MDE1476747.1 methyltransferase [Xenorhabdus bovienii]MDE1489278.1 methyltransferase [Xenorhabdus bovienii]MDE9432864.1 methyltransferase [Xenorhabdus bovienii]MDE9445628.1 methyltransferase [Xenorhabdus bovienii]MDE9457436.1 methyltransferase [Xenorhabdus bovienii]